MSRFAAPQRALLALVTTLAAWLVVVSHLTTALHFALISHEICADHGELVHGSSASHRSAAVPANAGDHAAALPGGTAEEHDHCPVLSRRIEHTAVLANTSVRLPPVTVEHACLVTDRDGVVPSRSALLLAAPKQSPPV